MKLCAGLTSVQAVKSYDQSTLANITINYNHHYNEKGTLWISSCPRLKSKNSRRMRESGADGIFCDYLTCGFPIFSRFLDGQI